MTATVVGEPVAHPAYSDAVDVIGRRRVLQLIAGAATFVGFSILGAFKFAPRAGAITYTEWGQGSQASACGTYDPDDWYGEADENGYWNANDCQNGACVGTYNWAMGRGYCSTCSEVNTTNPNQWHHSGYRGTSRLGDAGNICDVVPTQAARDAWRWQQSACGFCIPATWRCHDGFKRADDGTVVLTICQGLVYCNGSVYTGCNP